MLTYLMIATSVTNSVTMSGLFIMNYSISFFVIVIPFRCSIPMSYLHFPETLYA